MLVVHFISIQNNHNFLLMNFLLFSELPSRTKHIHPSNHHINSIRSIFSFLSFNHHVLYHPIHSHFLFAHNTNFNWYLFEQTDHFYCIVKRYSLNIHNNGNGHHKFPSHDHCHHHRLLSNFFFTPSIQNTSQQIKTAVEFQWTNDNSKCKFTFKLYGCL